ncbi:MAG: cytochrome c oxidase subunit [Chloroflexota bacterium]|jgi:cytochrome c oxidase subunit 2|nr:cytochrome c oxidase subunit [Chloroflexota bacterium]
MVRFATLMLVSGGFALLNGAAALADDSSKQQSMLDPAGPQAQHASDLYYIIMVPALLVLFIVCGMIIYAAVRFRRRSDDEMPRQVGGNNALEFTWTLIPAMILMGIFVLTLFQMPFLRDAPASASSAMHVTVSGRQWAWSFAYPNVKTVKAQLKVKAADAEYTTLTNDLVIPAGQVVNLDIRSEDVIHSWSVPRLSGRLDAIPGQVNHTWIQADAPGAYYGQCTEFCGLSHATMTVRVLALTPEDWNAWYAQQPRQ